MWVSASAGATIAGDRRYPARRMLGLPTALALFCAAVFAVALLAAGPRRLAALPVVGVVLALPALTDATPLLRFLLALCGVLVALRAIDLMRHDLGGLRSRLLHVVAAVDTRLVVRVAPAFDRASLARALPWLAPCVVALVGGFVLAPRADGALRLALRWGSCAVFAVAFFEFATRVAAVLALLGGARLPPLHDAPLSSRSVREFWGVRWNKLVGGWLRENVAAPLRTRTSAAAAMAAAFAVSAVIHWYLVAVSLDLRSAAVMAAFFVAQAALIASERALGVERWPTAAARAWTIVALLATAPLFVEPMMRLADPLLEQPGAAASIP